MENMKLETWNKQAISYSQFNIVFIENWLKIKKDIFHKNWFHTVKKKMDKRFYLMNVKCLIGTLCLKFVFEYGKECIAPKPD